MYVWQCIDGAVVTSRFRGHGSLGSGGMGASVQGVWGLRFRRYGGFGSGGLGLRFWIAPLMNRMKGWIFLSSFIRRIGDVGNFAMRKSLEDDMPVEPVRKQ
jgi:hypothetical protein